MTRRIYLSGPMTGFSDMNYGLFNSVAQKLRHEGHEVWNPAEAFNGDKTLPWTHYMNVCMRGLMTCDTVIALPHWWESVGARLEVAVALAIGLEVGEWEEIINDDDELDRRLLVAELLGMEIEE